MNPAVSGKGEAAARTGATRPLARAEITEVVQSVVATLRGDMTAADINLYHEVEGLALLIRTAKAEIAALRPDEIQEKHLPLAADELDAIVDATAEATHVILDSVEKIEAIGNGLPDDTKRMLGESVTRIYEACNFQDITGQRITKVVKTMKAIEAKVAALVTVFGDEIERVKAASDGASETNVNGPPSEQELLNGPQLPGGGNSQDDIDALFK